MILLHHYFLSSHFTLELEIEGIFVSPFFLIVMVSHLWQLICFPQLNIN
jgi:hypothetical protein